MMRRIKRIVAPSIFHNEAPPSKGSPHPPRQPPPTMRHPRSPRSARERPRARRPTAEARRFRSCSSPPGLTRARTGCRSARAARCSSSTSRTCCGASVGCCGARRSRVARSRVSAATSVTRRGSRSCAPAASTPPCRRSSLPRRVGRLSRDVSIGKERLSSHPESLASS